MVLGVAGGWPGQPEGSLHASINSLGLRVCGSAASAAATHSTLLESAGKTCGDIYSPNLCPHKGRRLGGVGRGREGPDFLIMS